MGGALRETLWGLTTLLCVCSVAIIVVAAEDVLIARESYVYASPTRNTTRLHPLAQLDYNNDGQFDILCLSYYNHNASFSLVVFVLDSSYDVIETLFLEVPLRGYYRTLLPAAVPITKGNVTEYYIFSSIEGGGLYRVGPLSRLSASPAYNQQFVNLVYNGSFHLRTIEKSPDVERDGAPDLLVMDWDSKYFLYYIDPVTVTIKNEILIFDAEEPFRDGNLRFIRGGNNNYLVRGRAFNEGEIFVFNFTNTYTQTDGLPPTEILAPASTNPKYTYFGFLGYDESYPDELWVGADELDVYGGVFLFDVGKEGLISPPRLRLSRERITNIVDPLGVGTKLDRKGYFGSISLLPFRTEDGRRALLASEFHSYNISGRVYLVFVDVIDGCPPPLECVKGDTAVVAATVTGGEIVITVEEVVVGVIAIDRDSSLTIEGNLTLDNGDSAVVSLSSPRGVPITTTGRIAFAGTLNITDPPEVGESLNITYGSRVGEFSSIVTDKKCVQTTQTYTQSHLQILFSMKERCAGAVNGIGGAFWLMLALAVGAGFS